MTRWRYEFFAKRLSVPVATETFGAAKEKLNEIGAEGWEIYEQEIGERIEENTDDIYASIKHITIRVWAKQPVEGGPYR